MQLTTQVNSNMEQKNIEGEIQNPSATPEIHASKKSHRLLICTGRKLKTGRTKDSFPAASLGAEKQLLDKSSAAHFRASPEDWCLKASSTDSVLKTCTAAEFHQLAAGRRNYRSQQSLRGSPPMLETRDGSVVQAGFLPCYQIRRNLEMKWIFQALLANTYPMIRRENKQILNCFKLMLTSTGVLFP